MSSLVDCQINNGVCIITLSAPPVNALTVDMVTELQGVQTDLVESGVRVAVVRSGIPGFFIAGADLKLLGEASAPAFVDYVDQVRLMIESFSEAPYLTIAGIDGHALGGGLELALACSIRVVGLGAKLGLPEVKLGVVPGAGGTQRLARLLPRGKALDLLLTGRSVGAEEAYDLGIVDRVVSEKEGGAEAALKLAQDLADGPIQAYQGILRCVNAARDLDFQSSMVVERNEVIRLFGSSDGREGIKAFLEKRKPVFGS